MPNWKICLRHGETMRVEFDHSLVKDCPMCILQQPEPASIGCAGKPQTHCPQCHHLEIHHDKNSGECETCREMSKSGAKVSYACTGNYAPPANLLKQPSVNEDLSAQLKASIAAVDAKKGWTRERLLRESAEHFDQCLDLLKRRNAEYAPDSDPFANFRDLRLLALVQEMNNVLCRFKRWADSDYRRVGKPMTEAQILDAERDMANFAALFHCLRLQLEGK